MGDLQEWEQLGTKCTSRSRCYNARECDYCAARRQQQIAGIAEKIEQQHGQLTLTRYTPKENTAAAIKAVHASFMRRALAPTGIWTVEAGELFGKLHLNIISPAPKAARWKCQSYSELLTGTAREAAAYISKRKGIPTPEQYAGRLYGSFGMIGVILATQETVPIVQGAAIEVALSGGRVQVHHDGQGKAVTREDFRDIARQHLGNLRTYAKEET